LLLLLYTTLIRYECQVLISRVVQLTCSQFWGG